MSPRRGFVDVARSPCAAAPDAARMRGRRSFRRWLFTAMIVFASRAEAAQLCRFSLDDLQKAPVAVRIARTACEEHALWQRPYINAQGRLVRVASMEAEHETLADGRTVAWQRVVHYWRESGLLAGHIDRERKRIAENGEKSRNGASDCAEDTRDWYKNASCRAFLIDTPWSAVFVSYVMKRSEVSGFVFSSSHYSYLRDAQRRPDTGPYRLADSAEEKPEIGDLVCYVREKGRVYGHRGLLEALRNSNYVESHCDIVVAVNLNGDSKLYAIGGNVIQGVTMRKLTLNARGRLSLQSKRGTDASAPAFEIADERTYSLNRQDWAALLKLNR